MAANEQAVREAGLILRWLEKNPAERALILWMAEHDTSNGRVPVDYHATGPDGVALLDANVAAVLGWMQAARFGPCKCFQPVVFFPNGQTLGWPELERHRCGGVAQLAEPPASTRLRAGSSPVPSTTPRPVDQRQSQRPQNARSGGSSPPRPTNTPRPRRTGV